VRRGSFCQRRRLAPRQPGPAQEDVATDRRAPTVHPHGDSTRGWSRLCLVPRSSCSRSKRTSTKCDKSWWVLASSSASPTPARQDYSDMIEMTCLLACHALGAKSLDERSRVAVRPCHSHSATNVCILPSAIPPVHRPDTVEVHLEIRSVIVSWARRNNLPEVAVALSTADDESALHLEAQPHPDAVRTFALDDQVISGCPSGPCCTATCLTCLPSSPGAHVSERRATAYTAATASSKVKPAPPVSSGLALTPGHRLLRCLG